MTRHLPTPDPPAAGEIGTGAPPDPVHTLAAAHRHVQAEQRAALSAENNRNLTAANHRADAIIDALHHHDATTIAELLTREAHAGLALIIALTCHDSPPTEIAAALDTYPDLRDAVDTALTEPTPKSPTRR